jgi:hypothetical protein
MTREDQQADSVRDVVVGVVHHIDAKRWSELRALYADEVATDYTSLFGGTPQKQTGDALIGGWRGALEKVQTHHILGPIAVELDAAGATARCHVRALHRAPGAPSGQDWEVLGHYIFELENGASGWKISAMKLETLIQSGNTKLLAEASAPASP